MLGHLKTKQRSTLNLTETKNSAKFKFFKSAAAKKNQQFFLSFCSRVYFSVYC